MGGSNQSAVIFGFLFAAFFVYITIKGELPVYAGLLLLSPAAGTTTGTTTAASSSSTTATAAANATANTIVQGAFATLGL